MRPLQYSELIKRRIQEWCRNELFEQSCGMACYLRTDIPATLEGWRCCEYWRRRLANKYNSRCLAEQLDIPVSTLYWVGEELDRIPFDSLPTDYAVRTCKGESRKGIVLIKSGRDLMSHKAMGPAEIRAYLAEQVRDKTDKRVLVEELLRPDRPGYEIPMEVRCHTFGDEIVLLVANVPRSRDEVDATYYFPDWTPTKEPIHVMWDNRATFRPDPPACLNEIFAASKRIIRFLGCYARIDFLVTDRGYALTEISLVPNRGEGYTTYANEYLAQYWQKYYPHGT